MVIAFLQRLVVSAAFVVIGASFAARSGVPVAILVAAAVSALAALLGAALLRTSPVGRVTWRNVVAGWLLPWGFVLGAERLPAIAMHSAACTTIMGAIGALAGSAYLLAAAWTLDAIALFALVRAFARQQGNPSARMRLAKPMLVVLGLAVAGGVLLSRGRPVAAALVAAGPLVAGAVFYGLWLAVVVTAGRKGRWN